MHYFVVKQITELNQRIFSLNALFKLENDQKNVISDSLFNKGEGSQFLRSRRNNDLLICFQKSPEQLVCLNYCRAQVDYKIRLL